jgi:hypothetical protein
MATTWCRPESSSSLRVSSGFVEPVNSLDFKMRLATTLLERARKAEGK